jgi:L,D-transpeptidase catalytic domain
VKNVVKTKVQNAILSLFTLFTSPLLCNLAGPEQVRKGQLFVRQRPGPKNSLALIKFIFPNEFDVYLHDTPATELFAESRREFSHGCIRLEKLGGAGRLGPARQSRLDSRGAYRQP